MSVRKTVYFVEDDEVSRDATETLLTLRGFWVEAFESAEDLLAVADTIHFGCILADYRLPGSNGLQLFQKLRRRGIDLPCILLSGHADNDVISVAMDAGVSEFLLKPVQPNALVERVQHWLDQP